MKELQKNKINAGKGEDQYIKNLEFITLKFNPKLLQFMKTDKESIQTNKEININIDKKYSTNEIPKKTNTYNQYLITNKNNNIVNNNLINLF